METTSRTCRWVSQRLPLLVGGDLVVSERRRVERHLIGCPACQDRRDASEQSLSILHDIASLGPVASGSQVGGDRSSVWPALARQIRESRHRPDRSSGWDWGRSWRLWNLQAQPVVGFGLIAGTLILGLGWIGLSGRSGPVEVARPAIVANPKALIVAAPVPPPTRLDPPDPIFTILDDFEVPVAQPERRASALPDGEALRGLAILKPGVNPFQSPLSLRLDYDLDWGTLSSPVQQDTHRAY